MRILSILTTTSFLFFSAIFSLPNQAQDIEGKDCLKIGRILSSNPRYLCWKEVYQGDGDSFLCFSSGEISRLEQGQRPKNCYPVIRSGCSASSLECDSTRGDSNKLRIISDSTFIERNPTIEWTPLSGAKYKLVLRDLSDNIIWVNDLQTTQIAYTGQLDPGLYKLTVFAYKKDNSFISLDVDAVRVLNPSKVARLEEIVSILNQLEIDPLERNIDLASIYAAIGIDSKARFYLSLPQ